MLLALAAVAFAMGNTPCRAWRQKVGM